MALPGFVWPGEFSPGPIGSDDCPWDPREPWNHTKTPAKMGSVITDDQHKALLQPTTDARAFLYLGDDGTWEIMPVEGGEFQLLSDHDDPMVFPLAGGPTTGKYMSALARSRD